MYFKLIRLLCVYVSTINDSCAATASSTKSGNEIADKHRDNAILGGNGDRDIE